MNPLQAAADYAYRAHHGERLKYVEGIYFTHPKAVSELMHSTDEKIVALLHDVVEHYIKACKAAYEENNQQFTDKIENLLIQERIGKIERYFTGKGFELSPMVYKSLDVLTRRTYETDYHAYILRIERFAKIHKCYIPVKVKRGDFYDNSRTDRNPPPGRQTDKDKARLQRYATGDTYLAEAFAGIPEAEPRSALYIAEIQGRAAKRRGRKPDRRRSKAERLRDRYGSALGD